MIRRLLRAVAKVFQKEDPVAAYLNAAGSPEDLSQRLENVEKGRFPRTAQDWRLHYLGA